MEQETEMDIARWSVGTQYSRRRAGVIPGNSAPRLVRADAGRSSSAANGIVKAPPAGNEVASPVALLRTPQSHCDEMTSDRPPSLTVTVLAPAAASGVQQLGTVSSMYLTPCHRRGHGPRPAHLLLSPAGSTRLMSSSSPCLDVRGPGYTI